MVVLPEVLTVVAELVLLLPARAVVTKCAVVLPERVLPEVLTVAAELVLLLLARRIGTCCPGVVDDAALPRVQLRGLVLPERVLPEVLAVAVELVQLLQLVPRAVVARYERWCCRRARLNCQSLQRMLFTRIGPLQFGLALQVVPG